MGFLKAARKEKYEIADMFEVFKRNYIDAILVTLISMIFVILGLIFFIVPGFIIMVRLAFAPYIVIDKKMAAMDAIKKSWNMTKGHSWTIFFMIILAILAIIGGLVALVVGVFFSIVWIASSFAILYNSVSIKKTKK